MRGMYLRLATLAVASCCICRLASAGTITTSTTCTFDDGQPTVSDPNICSIEQAISLPSYKGQAIASSSASYSVHGNSLTVSFSQGISIHEGQYASPDPGDLFGEATTDGNISLKIETPGSGTGLVEVLVQNLGGRDNAGEDDTGIGFTLAAFSMNCGVRPTDPCNFPSYPNTPFPMGSPFEFSMGESSYGFVDEANPFSTVSGTTTFELIFTDGNGNPVNIDPLDTSGVPEPPSITLVIAAALLLGCWCLLSRRKKSVVLNGH